MAEEEGFEGEEPEFESAGGGGRKRLMLMIGIPVAAVLVLGLAGFFLYKPVMAMFKGKPSAEETAQTAQTPLVAAKATENAAAVAASVPADFLDLPDILVNIDTAGRAKSFLKLKVAVELANETDVALINNATPKIIDNFQIYLRQLKPQDLTGAAGVYLLREELMNRINAAVRPAQVKDVIFKEFIVQ